MVDQPTSDARLQTVEAALRRVQGQAAALEELSEQLSLSVHVLEAELTALGRQAQTETQGTGEGADVQAAQAAPPRSNDVDGARLVALNMALEGQPREVVGSYVEEHFDVADRENLLDEVYAAVNT